MSHISKIFEEAPIKVPNRNGFDLSHVHSGTSKCGQLVPALTKLLAPNTTISLGVQAEVSLPPLVAPFFGKIDFAIEGFVVPLSILYGGWKNFITNNDPSNFPASQSALNTGFSNDTITLDGAISDNWGKNGYVLPTFPLSSCAVNDTASFATLDGTNDNIYMYMGLGYDTLPTSVYGSDEIKISMLPGLAYHKICDVFYRNTKLTRTWFEVNPNWQYTTAGISTIGGYTMDKNVSLIWHSFYTDDNYHYSGTGQSSGSIYTASASFDDTASLTFPDNTSFFSTRQRQYTRDYFTSAVPSPQQGGASSLKFFVDVSVPGQESGSFTVNSLRQSVALQHFLETNNLSSEYAETMRNRWGVRPIDADFDEPHYLGRVVIPVYKHTISQSIEQDDNYVVAGTNANAFTSRGLLGAQAATGEAGGEGSICDNFNVSTWSYLMCIASIYPHANYNYGLNKELTMTTLGEFPAPELQTVGMQDIKNYEVVLDGTVPGTWLNSSFGYIPRYSFFKYCQDHSSGELRPNKTLKQFQLQRYFTGTQQLGTSFVEIAQSDLDGVLAVNTSTMNLTCWWEIYFKLRVVMPLADFCVPTLGDVPDTHTIKTSVGGSRLA